MLSARDESFYAVLDALGDLAHEEGPEAAVRELRRALESEEVHLTPYVRQRMQALARRIARCHGCGED